MPVFGTFFSDPALQAQAEALCGNDAECLFDVATTERLDIGQTTLESSQIVEDLTTLASTGEQGGQITAKAHHWLICVHLSGA